MANKSNILLFVLGGVALIALLNKASKAKAAADGNGTDAPPPRKGRTPEEQQDFQTYLRNRAATMHASAKSAGPDNRGATTKAQTQQASSASRI